MKAMIAVTRAIGVGGTASQVFGIQQGQLSFENMVPSLVRLPMSSSSMTDGDDVGLAGALFGNVFVR